MKKVLKLLLLALISLAVMGCSDSDDNKLASGIIGYEAFVATRNAWKEPAGYSFTAEIFTNAIGPRSIDVKVENGVSVLSYTPNRYNSSRSPEEDLIYFPFPRMFIAGGNARAAIALTAEMRSEAENCSRGGGFPPFRPSDIQKLISVQTA